MVNIGVNQPYYLPYIGFFERMKACDYFVINPFTPLNRVKAFHRRVKIIQQHPTAEKDFLYLTQCLPPKTDGKNFDKIKLDGSFWRRQDEHAMSIYYTYKNSPHFNYLRKLPELLNDRQPKNLASYNTRLIKFLAEKLFLEDKIADAMDQPSVKKYLKKRSPKNFVNKGTYTSHILCWIFSGKRHLVGQNGPLWLDEKPLKERGVQTRYQRINFEPYHQKPGREKFVPGLSVIDLLFNYGEYSNEILGKNSDFVKKKDLIKTTELTGR